MVSVLVIGQLSVFLLQVKRRLDLETDHQYLAGSSGPFRGRGRHPGKGAIDSSFSGPDWGRGVDMVVHSGAPVGCPTGLPQALEVGSCPATRGMLWLADNSHRAFLLSLRGGRHLPHLATHSTLLGRQACWGQAECLRTPA